MKLRLCGAPPSGSHSLQQQSETKSAAHAKSCESELRIALLHFMDQRSGDAHARAADRMTEGDCTTVDVQAIGVEFQFAIARDHLGGECFVEFDEIDLVQRQILACE